MAIQTILKIKVFPCGISKAYRYFFKLKIKYGYFNQETKLRNDRGTQMTAGVDSCLPRSSLLAIYPQKKKQFVQAATYFSHSKLSFIRQQLFRCS